MVNFDLSFILAQFIAYLAYTTALAGALQVAINTIKPIALTPLKARYGDKIYLMVMYVFRIALTIVGYFTFWGGVEATRALLPSLSSSIPDFGIFIVTILLIVLGEEFIHALTDRAYASKKAVDSLNTGVTTTTTTTASPNAKSFNISNEALRSELLG